MTCYNENCIWRSNYTPNVLHCDYSYTCPNKTDKYSKYTVSDHAETQAGNISISNKTDQINANTKMKKIIRQRW